jgi:hypothetical protein
VDQAEHITIFKTRALGKGLSQCQAWRRKMSFQLIDLSGILPFDAFQKVSIADTLGL